MGRSDHRLHEQKARADDEAAIGEVEDRPLDVIEVQEIADAVEDEAVVEIARRFPRG